ncbi:MAG: BtpA/SgcQ family protein [Caldilineaceae bacterium]
MPLFDASSSISGTRRRLVIALVHLRPMPGTPHYRDGDLQRSIEKAKRDAEALLEGGADGCLLQTVDRIYPAGDEADHARVAGMTAVACAVRALAPPPFKIGVQIMWNGIRPSLAVAKASGADFVRCAVLIGSSQSPLGVINSDPLGVLTYRRVIDAESVGLVAEVNGMHYKSALPEQSTADIARMATNALAEAVEVAHAEEASNEALVAEIKAAHPNLPVMLGGHTRHENAARRLASADGAFVGTCLERGAWGSEIDVDKVRAYVDIVRSMA